MDSLSKHINKHYKLVGLEPGIIFRNGTKYDLRTISKQKADQLIASGFQNLKPIELPKKAKAKN